MIVIDEELAIPVYSDLCSYCRHWHVEPGRKCDAFLDGIPMPIWMAENNHRQPYAGDHGIQFEAVPATKAVIAPPATATPDPRDADEAALREALEALFRTLAPDVADMLAKGQMPTDKELADAFSAVLRPALVEAAMEEFRRQANDVGVQFDPSYIDQKVVAWAQSYTYELVRGINETTLKQLRQVMAQWPSTPGMTRAELEALIRNIRDGIDPAFSPARAELIATTEITRAQSRSQSLYQEEIGAMGIPMERVWHTIGEGPQRISHVCDLCAPLDKKPESVWGKDYPDGPPRHVGCRCRTTLRSVKLK